MKMFYQMNGCRVLPLYGTLDLVTNDTMPICGREAMWTMMPILRMRSKNPEMDAMMTEAESRCPRDCWQEKIDMQMSFTILSDETFEKAWKIWPVPPNRTKFDAVFMELFYTTLAAEVIKTSFDDVDKQKLIVGHNIHTDECAGHPKHCWRNAGSVSGRKSLFPHRARL